MPAWFDTPDGQDKHGQVATLQDGRVIAWAKNYVVATYTNGCQAINVRVPDLRTVEHVFDVQFTENPLDCGARATPYGAWEAKNKKITGNVVGMTVQGNEFATGTTLTVKVTAIGSP